MQPTQRAPFALAVTKVVREFVRPETSEHGGSIGQYIDHYLASQVESGAELQEVKVVFSEDGTDWAKVREYYHPMTAAVERDDWR